MEKFEKCPHCGNAEGLYSKECVRYSQYYSFDGEGMGFSEFADVRYRKNIPLYCMTCNRRVTTHKELLGGGRYKQCG